MKIFPSGMEANYTNLTMPGIFVVSFALWWTVNVFSKYFKSNASSKKHAYTNSCFFIWRNWIPFDEMVLFYTIGLGVPFLEFLNIFENFSSETLPYLTMYFPFVLPGIASYFGRRSKFLPSNLDYALLSLAFALMGLLFHFKNDDANELVILVNAIITMVATTVSVSILVEMANPKSVLAALFRSCLTLVLGTWLIHGGALSHSNDGKLKNLLEPSTLAVYLIWHFIGNLFLLGIIGYVQHWRLDGKEKEWGKSKVNEEEIVEFQVE